jgi:hypothetical protein
MSQHTEADQRAPGDTAPAGPSSQTEVARDEASGVGRSIEEAGEHVARTASRQARDVTSETTRQARRLVDDGVGQLRTQAREGQHKAAVGLRGVADQLREMTKNSSQPGLANEIVQQASDQAHGAASWLERHEPDDLIEEVRGFARRRPGTFLLGAALAGVAAGRLTRGAVDPRTSDHDGTPPPQPPPQPPPAAPVATPAEAPAATEPAYPPTTGAAGPVRPGAAPDAAPERGYREPPEAWDPATDPPLGSRP